nr:hypothetical protein FVER53263_08143 [Fusarium verticillioides]
MSQPYQMNAPQQGNLVRRPASESPRSEEVNAPSTRPGIDLERQAGSWAQVLIRTSQVLALDKPGSYFLRHLLPSFRTMLEGESGKYLDAPMHDWASLSQPDRLDQLTCLAGYTKIGRVLLTPFLTGQDEVGDNDQYHYNDGAIRFISITIFSSIIAVFACAPAAIQSLNVRSTVGEVVVYLVFVIVFGWLSQGLILGFEKVLLSCLAYAGLMATLLRGG